MNHGQFSCTFCANLKADKNCYKLCEDSDLLLHEKH